MLKFEGIEIGTRIRAYDFKPMSDQPDWYVEGVITAAGMTDEGYKAYTVAVDVDTVHTDDPRKTVFAPMEVFMMEWDERIQILEG